MTCPAAFRIVHAYCGSKVVSQTHTSVKIYRAVTGLQSVNSFLVPTKSKYRPGFLSDQNSCSWVRYSPIMVHARV